MDIIMWRWIFLIFIWIIQETEEVKDAKLIIKPRILRAGTSATLLCLYDLEKAPLYSVQWYRGKFEFFRYNPNEDPPYKIFELPGFNVDVYKSDEHQVTLRNIPTHISGEISCEITADGYFKTSCVSSMLTVIELDLDFQIFKKSYNTREIITANCSSYPSDIRTKLIFYIDNKRVSEKFIKHKSHDFATLEIDGTSIELDSFKGDRLIDITCLALLDGIHYITGRTISIELHDDSAENFISNKSTKKYLNIDIMLIFMLYVIKCRY